MEIQEKIEEIENSSNAELKEFFSLLLASKLIAHIHHFRVTGEGSYAKHKALNEFYDAAGEIADTIIETYQGCKKELVEFDTEDLMYGVNIDSLSYLRGLRAVIQLGRKNGKLRNESNLQNEIDNFVTLIDQTVYKLTFLK